MKNAIYGCLPQFGVILAGGNPWTMLIGAVSQLGTMYFNYRRNRNQYQMGKDKSLWELRKDDIEDLHQLRKALFNASWELARKYSFPDEWRLSQAQVENYVTILQDGNPYQRHERLSYIQDEFLSFPPFWCEKAKAATEGSRTIGAIGAIAKRMRDSALEAYNRFDDTWFPILRADPHVISVSLDRLSLLDHRRDGEKIGALADTVYRHGKQDFSAIQVIALHYLAIGRYDEATRLLRMLVNESKNVEVNGKLLSRIYLERAEFAEFDLLSRRVGDTNVENATQYLQVIGGQTCVADNNHVNTELDDEIRIPAGNENPEEIANLIAYHIKHLFEGYTKCHNVTWALHHAKVVYDLRQHVSRDKLMDLNNTGYVFMKSALYDKAKACFKLALDMANSSTSVTKQNAALVKYNLGLCMVLMGDLQEGVEQIEDALRTSLESDNSCLCLMTIDPRSTDREVRIAELFDCKLSSVASATLRLLKGEDSVALCCAQSTKSGTSSSGDSPSINGKGSVRCPQCLKMYSVNNERCPYCGE